MTIQTVAVTNLVKSSLHPLPVHLHGVVLNYLSTGTTLSAVRRIVSDSPLHALHAEGL
jgi:hypothetical protein